MPRIKEIGTTLDIPSVDRRTARRAVTLLEGAEQRDAEGFRLVGPAEQTRHFRRNFLAVLDARVMHRLDTHGSAESGIVEGPRGVDIDRTAQTARLNRGPARLVDFQRLDTFGGQVGEVEGAGGAEIAVQVRALVAADRRDIGGRHAATVQGHQGEPAAETADGDERALAIHTVDGDTGNPLEGLGEIGIRETADVLGRDGIDHTVGVPLDVHRALQRATHPGHGDDILVGRGVLGQDRRGNANRDAGRTCQKRKPAQMADMRREYSSVRKILHCFLPFKDFARSVSAEATAPGPVPFSWAGGICVPDSPNAPVPQPRDGFSAEMDAAAPPVLMSLDALPSEPGGERRVRYVSATNFGQIICLTI